MKYKIILIYREPFIKEFADEDDFEDWLDKNYEVVESFEKLEI